MTAEKNIATGIAAIKRPLGLSFAYGLLACLIAGVFFKGVSAIAASALLAISFGGLMQEFLEENRKAIWEEGRSPVAANSLLAFQFSSLFIGMFLAAGLFQLLAPEHLLSTPITRELAFRNEFWSLWRHNLQILVAGTVFTALYRAGGLVVILGWNAVNWAEALFAYVSEIYHLSGVLPVVLVGVSLLPHLLFELVAYVLAGMSGLFISKAFQKYSAHSQAFFRVSQACFVIMLTAVASLFLANCFEFYLAQRVFHLFG